MNRPAETPAERRIRRERAFYEAIGRGVMLLGVACAIVSLVWAFARGGEAVPWW